MSEEKLYQFNEYVLGYDKGYNDRSCLTISKIQNDTMYVMSSLYDGSADVISLMLDSLQEELRQTKLLKEKYQLKKDKQKEVLDKIKEYIKNNEKCIVECSGRDFMTGMPYEKIKTGLIEKARIEELLEKIE